MRVAQTALLLGILSLPSLPAQAADLPERAARFEDGSRYVTVSAAFPEVFDSTLESRIDSGFAMTIVVRAYLFREGQDKPDALAVRTFRVAYDLWDEVYLVEERDDAGVRSYRVRTRKEAIARVSTIDRLPIGEIAWMALDRPYVVRFLVEVNPISPEVMASVRRWLTRPQGPHRFAGDGESFFGSFVSIFVNPRVGDAEKVLRFRTARYQRHKGAN